MKKYFNFIYNYYIIRNPYIFMKDKENDK